MTDSRPSRVSTNVPGLDSVLHGGFLAKRSYLVTGGPGAGKTTLGMHFLAGAPPGEALLVSFAEVGRDIRADAASMGLLLGGVTTIDLSPGNEARGKHSYTLLEPWEAETPDLRARIEEVFPNAPPRRVFIDALSQLRYLLPDTFQFRKEVISLLEYLTAAGATVLFSAERGSEADTDLQYLGDGILQLEATETGRTLSLVKFRGSGFAEGRHTVRLNGRGMQVYERLIPGHHGREFRAEALQSGVPTLDELVGGGLGRGTVTVISGPTGVGKTSLGLQFLWQASRRGERSAIFTFEENLATLRHRCQHIAIPLDMMVHEGSLAAKEVEPLCYTPDEFAAEVRHEVEACDTRIVMIDSLSGYRQSVRGEDVALHVHALCRYLANMGVTVLLVNEAGAVAGGELRVSECGISYLADAVLLLRYIELNGQLRKTIGMLKKRTGDFEKHLREFEITSRGIHVGEPLRGLRGILRGVPEVAFTETNR